MATVTLQPGPDLMARLAEAVSHLRDRPGLDIAFAVGVDASGGERAAPVLDRPGPDIAVGVQKLTIQCEAANRHLELLEVKLSSLIEQNSGGVLTSDRVRLLWDDMCEGLATGLIHVGLPSPWVFRPLRRVLAEHAGIQARILRLMIAAWPELADELPVELEAVVWPLWRTPLAFLRTMWNLFYCALRYPRSETVIDWETGRVLYHTHRV